MLEKTRLGKKENEYLYVNISKKFLFATILIFLTHFGDFRMRILKILNYGLFGLPIDKFPMLVIG